jgi:hypothetical protein
LIEEQLNRDNNQNINLPSRESRIPSDIVKVTPQTDAAPPKSLSQEYANPVPVNGKVNTAGAEDSAFILPDGNTLYFIFVPDVRLPVEQQILDPTVGIYVSRMENNSWNEPERIVLQDPDKLAMDGAEFVQDNLMYFCSAREGYTGVHWFKAEFKDGKWQNWENADHTLKMEEYETGELHISSDGNDLYFHSARSGGKGGLDIWVSEKVDGEWSEPVNVAAVNTARDEGWPALSPSGKELWFSRDYGIWRSQRVNGEWQPPEEMFFPLAGEPSVDNAGNVYFTHHFFKNDTMVEADIYVAYRRQPMKGVSLTPRSSQEDDFLDFFERAKQTGNIVTWAGDWNELGKIGGSPQVLTEIVSTYDLIPFVEVTPQSNGVLLRPLNETIKQIYKNDVVAFAGKYKPAYLGLGIEINLLYEKSPEDFDEFVEFYNDVYNFVKAESPNTKVFTIFQLEKMKGYTIWSNELAKPDKEQWFLLEKFKIDICAFTTYPCLIFKDPSEIPRDYYTEISNYTTKPIAFTEIGWHSEASPLGWESSEAEQAEFIETFHSITKDMNVEITIWSFLYDQKTIEPFRSMGLLREDGTARPAWDFWQPDE